MSRLFLLILIGALGVSAYLNYKSSRQLEADRKAMQSEGDRVKKLEAEVAQEKSRERLALDQQKKAVELARAKLDSARADLIPLEENLNRQKNLGVDRSTADNLASQIADSKGALAELDREIKNTEQELNLSKTQGKNLNSQQRELRTQTDNDLKLHIQADQAKISALDAQARTLRPKKFDYNAQQTIHQLDTQISEMKAEIAALQERRRQFILQSNGDQAQSAAQILQYQENINQSLGALRERRASEKSHLDDLTRQLQATKGSEKNQLQDIQKTQAKYQEQVKKIKDAEVELRDQEARLNQ